MPAPRARTFASLAAALLLSGTAEQTVHADQGSGTLADPIRVDALPYAIKGTTTAAPGHAIARYSCASQDESGGEVVYSFSLPARARVTAWVEDPVAGVDVDVHLLSDTTLQGDVAASCVARGDVIAEAELDAGTRYVVVDTYVSDTRAGDYILRLDAVGDSWRERVLTRGVTWKSRRYASLSGGPQVVNLLEVDPSAAGVQVRAIAASGCQTVAAIGAGAGAVAGINGGYFDTGCAPVSLLKASGQLLGTNGSSTARGAFGLSAAKVGMVALVAGGADWPAAWDAHGGGPILVGAGSPRSGAAAWAVEGFSSASFLAENPRTLAGVDAQGHVLLAAFDGRRGTALGLSMDDAAACAAGELGATDMVNLDGGGSTTMWVAGATPNGVVNYPSDAGATELANHSSARAVSGGFFVFGPPLNHPPRFQTLPPLEVRAGEDYLYDADALDLDVDDVVTFSLLTAPGGMTVDAQAGIIRWRPVGPSAQLAVSLEARDGRGAATIQSFVVSVVDGPPAADGGSSDAATVDGAADGGRPVLPPDTGCSIAATGGRPRLPAPWACLLLPAVVVLLRRRLVRNQAWEPKL